VKGEGEGNVGYCESYLGVKYTSVRPLTLINVATRTESWDLYESKHQGKYMGADNSIVLQQQGRVTAGTNLATVHCAEERIDGSNEGWGEYQEEGRTNEPQRPNQRPPTLEIQTVLPHHRWTDVSSDWSPIQPRCLLWAEPCGVIGVAVFRKSTQ